MQDERGKMHEISQEEFEGLLTTKSQTKAQRIVRVGDVFKVRSCTFEVSEITTDGIYAKGISYHEWLSRRPRKEGE